MSGGGFFDTDNLGESDLKGSVGPRPPIEKFFDDFGAPAIAVIIAIGLILLLRSEWGKSVKAGAHGGNRLIIMGCGLAVATVLLMDPRYGTGILSNILEGAEILGTGIQARWPILVAVVLICLGLVRRLSPSQGVQAKPPDEE